MSDFMRNLQIFPFMKSAHILRKTYNYCCFCVRISIAFPAWTCDSIRLQQTPWDGQFVRDTMYLHLPSAACPSCHCGGGYRAAESRVHPLRLPWQPRILRLQYQNRWHRNAENHYHQAYTEGFAVFIFVSSRQTHGKYRSLIILLPSS